VEDVEICECEDVRRNNHMIWLLTTGRKMYTYQLFYIYVDAIKNKDANILGTFLCILDCKKPRAGARLRLP
jgi:hypothetical protein